MADFKNTEFNDNSVPYIVHEGTVMRQEKTIVRQWITIILLIVLLVASNLAWIYYESQFEDTETTTTVTQELDAGQGDAIINDGVHINGENETDDN